MDIEKYINDNLDELIESEEYSELDKKININENINNDENINNENEEPIEVFQNEDEEFEKEIINEELINIANSEQAKEEEEEYYFDLMNIFIKYFNDKFNKKNNFFSGIENNVKDTTAQMELFFEAIIEYKQLKNKMNIEFDKIAMNYFFEEDKKEKIKLLFENNDSQIYCLEIINKKLYTPSLIICLNYILENYNNNYVDIDWKIYNLRNL